MQIQYVFSRLLGSRVCKQRGRCAGEDRMQIIRSKVQARHLKG